MWIIAVLVVWCGILFVMVLSFMLTEYIALLPRLPWLAIVIATALVYLIGCLWYGALFRKQYMRLIQNKNKDTNWTAMVVQLLGTFTLVSLVGVFSLFEAIFLLGLDALTGAILFVGLAGSLFQRGNTRDAVQYWIITAGYEVVTVLIAALVIIYLA